MGCDPLSTETTSRSDSRIEATRRDLPAMPETMLASESGSFTAVERLLLRGVLADVVELSDQTSHALVGVPVGPTGEKSDGERLGMSAAEAGGVGLDGTGVPERGVPAQWVSACTILLLAGRSVFAETCAASAQLSAV